MPALRGRSIEKLKCFNRLLLAVLQGYKGRCESLSMQLGQREAEATALHLALQYRSVPNTHGGGGGGWGGGCMPGWPCVQDMEPSEGV